MADSAIWTSQEDIDAERETLRRWREDLGRSLNELKREEEALPISAGLAERIRILEPTINEYQVEINRVEERLRSRTEEVSKLQTRIAEIESPLRLPIVSPVQQYIISEVVNRLKRTQSTLYGWQTRDTNLLESLLKARLTEERSLDALRSQLQTIKQSRIDRSEALAAIQGLEERIRAEESRLSRKKVKPLQNLLIALHKRWQYKSSRGAGHDISIEAIATIIVGPEERKEDYEVELETALEEAMRGKPGFERLSGVTPEVLGFEERLTDQKQRGVKVEEISWQHKIVAKQLNITDFLGLKEKKKKE